MEEGGGGCDGAAGFGDELGLEEDAAHGVADVGLGDGKDAVDIRANVLEVQRADGLRAQAVGAGARGVGSGQFDQFAGAKALGSIGGEFGLGAEDAHVFLRQLGCGRDAADESAAADRSDDGAHVRQVFEDLERERALARDDEFVVVRRNDGVAVSSGERFGFFLSLGTCGSHKHDLGAEAARAVDLYLGSIVRHDDDGFRLQGAGGVGDTLRMVTAGITDDAARAFRVGERGDLVVGAAQLERADGLLALELQVDVRRGPETHERGADGDAADAFAGGVDSIQVDHERVKSFNTKDTKGTKVTKFVAERPADILVTPTCAGSSDFAPAALRPSLRSG